MSILDEICYELHNYFEIGEKTGEFTFENGGFEADFLREGQYFRVIGSVFNDGIHQYPPTELIDETFTGEIIAMAVPKDLLDIVDEIDEWKNKYEKVNSSPYMFESFGGYTYSKGSFKKGSKGGVLTWQDVFYDRIKRWYNTWL